MAVQPSTALEALQGAIDGRTGPVSFEDLRDVLGAAIRSQQDIEYGDYMGEDM